MYKYGMKLRGFSIGCQPMYGFIGHEEDKSGTFWDFIYYKRKLTDKEVRDYDLEYLGEVEWSTLA